jgi:hypothetical protein
VIVGHRLTLTQADYGYIRRGVVIS